MKGLRLNIRYRTYKPIALLLLLWAILTQQVVYAASTYFFSSLSMRDGLPSNIIAAVTQDKYDFMWIGTRSGLARYDGYNFKLFKKNESPNSLPFDEISSLFAHNGYVWVGTWNGLCKINIETFEITRIYLGEKVAIRTFYKGKDDLLWIGTNDGLIRYSIDKDEYKRYTTNNSGLSHNTIRTIHEDTNGNLWVGTYDKLNKLSNGRGRFTNLNLKGNYRPALRNHLILDIKPDHSSAGKMIWVGTETGLYHVNIETGSFSHFSNKQVDFSNEVVKCIYADDESNLWLGTDFGLNILNAETGTVEVAFHNPQLPYSLPNNVIWQIFEDSSGVIWIVTSNGLSRINKHGNFYKYQEITHKVEGQPIGNQVKSLLIASDGIYWLGTQHGVIRLDPDTEEQRVFDMKNSGLLLNNVFALEEDSSGRIWIGSAGGINVWDPEREHMYAITANGSNGLASNYIGKFTKTADGTLWVSVWEGGLYKIEGAMNDLQFIPVEELESVSEKTVSGNGSLWVISYDELYRVDPETHKVQHIPSFSKASEKQMINSVYFSKAGHLWAGTLNGLVQYLPGENRSIFHPVAMGNDLIINSIQEDRNGNIWSTTNTSLQKLGLSDQHLEIYPLDKDLPLKSFYYGCAASTNEGAIIFGGDNGYIIFSPDQAKPNFFDPNVYITAMEINHKSISVNDQSKNDLLLRKDIAFTESLELEYNQRSVTFEFSSLHYWQPSMNVFSYMLEGLDEEWNYVSGKKNFAVYSNLPPGDYTFKVKGTNNYGVPGSQTAQLTIEVNPPLFLSNGFIALYLLTAAGLVLYGLRFYSARVHLRNELRIIKMEKKHAEELEHTKEQFFTNISHELRTPISLILPPIHEIQKRGTLDPESNSLIELAEKNSLRLLRLVNQILDFNKLENETLQIKISQIDLINFCREVFALFAHQAKRSNIIFNFHTTHQSYPVWLDVEKMETVLFNLLSNAFKFTPKDGKIELSILVQESAPAFKEGAFEIKISDTGLGISHEDQEKIFERFYQSSAGKRIDASSGIGLTLAYEYIELHHGKIEVDSQVGKGTSFRIQLPLGKSHFPLDSVSEKEVNLLATRSLYAPREGSKNFHFDLESDNPLVLIIEDNNDMVEFIRTSLGYKYNFVVAENGEEGLIKADNFMPEVIISDIMMPVMDGLTMCKKIKENPKTSHITIILLTAKSLEGQRLEGIRKGADVYLTKPFEMDLLDAHIQNLIRRKQELNQYFRKELVNQQAKPREKDNVDNKFIKKVMDIIEANISDPEFSVELISHEIGLSSTHLYRRLKALTNRSPQEIIKKYRIKKASLLLQNNEGNISETMYKVGFSSLSYFSRCFKSEFGMTPKEYQQKMADRKVNLVE